MELLFVFLLLQVLSPCLGYATGAPTSTCNDMLPRHSGSQPQPTATPYTILTSARTFQAGQPITVTINGPEYTGILLAARSGTSTDDLGSWKSPPVNTKFLKCSGNTQGAITHANTIPKNNATVFTWIPPNNNITVYFKATIAQQRTVYWVNIQSEMLTKGSDGIDLASGGHPGMASEGFLQLLAPCLLLSLMLPR
ncbi:hypothetical protein UPYG_G00116240 [Umbra pygmaea]|uniref:Reelin domain-containing protein n=1 Tax=Umbra pygmaea TaxID=75934 RepID=A0ABD0X3W5_UMBPY